MASFGEELRRERELRGVELRDVSEATKVNLRFLEALERGDFDSLPGGVFTRGFIRAYANHIGADAEKLVNAYLYEVSRREERARAESGQRPLPRLDPAARRAPRRRVLRWVAPLAALSVVATAAAVLWLGTGVGRGTAGPALAGEPSAPPPHDAPAASATASPGVPARGEDVGGSEPAARTLEIAASAAAEVRVACNGEPLIARPLVAGALVQVPCAGELRVDADPGGAVVLRLDGEEVPPPADPHAPRSWSSPPAPAAP